MIANRLRTDSFDVKFKVVLLGESMVGKTSLIQTLDGRRFDYHTMSTIGVDFIKKVFEIKGNKVMLEIWDTAGQERFRSISAFHFRGADCFIFVYDVTSLESLEKITSHWLKNVDDMFDDPLPVFLVGNKIDCDENREVTREEGEKVHERQYSHGFFETSAKTGENVDLLFTTVAEKLGSLWGLTQKNASKRKTLSSDPDVVKLDSKPSWMMKRPQCCAKK